MATKAIKAMWLPPWQWNSWEGHRMVARPFCVCEGHGMATMPIRWLCRPLQGREAAGKAIRPPQDPWGLCKVREAVLSLELSPILGREDDFHPVILFYPGGWQAFRLLSISLSSLGVCGPARLPLFRSSAFGSWSPSRAYPAYSSALFIGPRSSYYFAPQCSLRMGRAPSCGCFRVPGAL